MNDKEYIIKMIKNLLYRAEFNNFKDTDNIYLQLQLKEWKNLLKMLEHKDSDKE